MTSSNSTMPAAAAELCSWSLSGDTELRALRGLLRRMLETHGLVDREQDANLVDEVLLVASELVANALQHGKPPRSLRLLRADGHFILDVTDHAADTMPQVAAASLTRSRGRGLFIARAVAHKIGWHLTGTVKHVWAAFPIQPPPPARAVAAAG